ncbi:EamA family transporter [Clostridium sp.]|uniref:EamA family transporter n=1 Tax=Clostridium sp. TaxID=1506 RepID=UPI0034639F3A
MLYTLLFINILLLVTGQTLWKIGLEGNTMELSFKGIINLIFNPYIFSGIVLYGIATIIWFYILSKGDLSLVYPLQSLCYVLAIFVAMFIFKESIPVTRWIGVIFIVIGAFFVAIK